MNEPVIAVELHAWSGDAEASGSMRVPLDWLASDDQHSQHLVDWIGLVVAASVGPAATVGGYTLRATAQYPDEDDAEESPACSAAVSGALDGDTDDRKAAVWVRLDELWSVALPESAAESDR